MLKFWGGTLVIVGCSYLGLIKAQSFKKNVCLTQDFILALSYLKREITQHQNYLPDILLSLSEKEYTTTGHYFKQLLLQLEDSNPFVTKWENSLQYEGKLPEKLSEILEPLGRILGQYDSDEQGRSIANILEHLSQLKDTQEEESKRLGKVYSAMGITLGFFLVILLI